MQPRRAPRIFGRAAEIEAVLASIEDGARLVTFVGPGGIGKTALAHAAAHEAEVRGLVDRVVLGALEAASDVAGIVDAVAMAAGAPLDAGSDGVARVGAALAAAGSTLLVLDDFDGLVEHALPTVGAWLELAPELTIVATSRERLALAAEHVHEVGPLASESIDLLVAAAKRADAKFALRTADQPHAEAIVQLLEGVPLALELAGARLPLFGARALEHRLRSHAESLATDARGAPDRHASLDAAVRDSFDGLAPDERDVLAQLTVFHGGFTAETVLEVVEAASPIDALERLRARSLVRTTGPARFDLYASIRAFVIRMYSAPIAEAEARHATWFVARAEAAASRAHVDAEARAFLVDERDNVLAVARRVLDAKHPPTAREAEPALRAMVALHAVLAARGPVSAMAAALGPLVERTRDSGADPRLSARVSMLRGALRRERGDLKGALKDLLAADSIARAVDDAALLADVGFEMGRTMLSAGEPAAAEEHFDRAARAFAALAARGREGEATMWLALVRAEKGALDDACALLERAVGLAGDDAMIAPVARLVLARASADRGDVPAARTALARVGKGGEVVAAAAAMVEGFLAWDAGEIDAAHADFVRARDGALASGLEAEAALALGFLGALAAERGDASAYPSLAAARDVCAREGRREASAIFGVVLAHLDRVASRGETATATLAAAERELGLPARELLAPWPLGAASIVALARASDAAAALRDQRARGAVPIAVRLVARVLASRARSTPALPVDALVIGPEGAWFRAPSAQRVGLERRRSLALVVHRLAEERVTHPGATLTAAELFASAWAGERAIPSAAAHRVRVAIATLRKMGLRDALVTTVDGYAFDAAVPLVRA